MGLGGRRSGWGWAGMDRITRMEIGWNGQDCHYDDERG